MSLPLPHWIETIPEKARGLAVRRFYLRLAALYATPDGRASALGVLMGYARKSMVSWLNPSSTRPIPHETVKKISDATGGVVKPEHLTLDR